MPIYGGEGVLTRSLAYLSTWPFGKPMSRSLSLRVSTAAAGSLSPAASSFFAFFEA